MYFEVKGKKDKTKLDVTLLLDMLIGQVVKNTKDEFTQLSRAFSEYLQRTQVLGSMPIGQLVTTSFALGYFYRVFLEKNEVEIKGNVIDENNGTNITERTSEETSEGVDGSSNGDDSNSDSPIHNPISETEI